MGASVVGEVVGVAVVFGAPVVVGTSTAVGALIEKRSKEAVDHILYGFTGVINPRETLGEHEKSL